MGFKERLGHFRKALAPGSTRADNATINGVSLSELAAWFGNAASVDKHRLIRDGYSDHTNIYTNIQQLTSAAKAVPWQVQLQTRDGPEPTDPDHPVRELLNEPNPWHTWEFIVEHLLGSLMLDGNAYAMLNGPSTGAPREIIPLPAHKVHRQQNRATMGIDSYNVQLGASDKTVPRERMIHVWLWDPSDPFEGQGPIEPSSVNASLAHQFRKWNLALTQQGAQPSGVATTDKNLSDKQYQRMKEQVQDNHGGAEKAGKIMLLEAIDSFDTAAFNPKEMQWSEGVKETRRELATAMGVPPELVGDPETKIYNNARLAQLAIYQNKVFPLLKQVAQEMQQKLREWHDDLVLSINRDEVPAVQEQRREMIEGVVQLVRFGVITQNEARDMLGREQVDGADDLLLPMSLAPAAGGQPSEETMRPGEEPENPQAARRNGA